MNKESLCWNCEHQGNTPYCLGCGEDPDWNNPKTEFHIYQQDNNQFVAAARRYWEARKYVREMNQIAGIDLYFLAKEAGTADPKSYLVKI